MKNKSTHSIKRCLILEENRYYLTKEFKRKHNKSKFKKYYTCLKYIGSYEQAVEFAKRNGHTYVPKPKTTRWGNIKELDKACKPTIKQNNDKAFTKLPPNERLNYLVKNTYYSTKFIGNNYTLEEVYDVIKKNKKSKRKHNIRYKVVKNHLEANQYIFKISKNNKISEEHILRIHKLVVKNLSTVKRTGRYRFIEVYQRGIDIIYPLSKEVQPLLKTLISFINKNIGKLNPALLSVIAHHEFLKIHPFSDGNGRCARLLSNWILLNQNYLPILIPGPKMSYFKSILKTSSLKHDCTKLSQFWINSIKVQTSKITELSQYKEIKGKYLEAKFDIFLRSKIKSKSIQGYKVHISATKKNALNTLLIVLPILLKNRVHHKFVKHDFYVSDYNKPWINVYGKFITIYCDDLKKIIPILIQIDLSLASTGIMRGRSIPGEIKMWKSKSNVIYYRYGSYYDKFIVDESSNNSRHKDLKSRPFPDFIKNDNLKFLLQKHIK